MGGNSPMLGGAPPTSTGGLDFLGFGGSMSLPTTQKKEVYVNILTINLNCHSGYVFRLG